MRPVAFTSFGTSKCDQGSRIYDEKLHGEIPEQKTDAYISGGWYTIARNQMKYNSTGKQRTFENLGLLDKVNATSRFHLLRNK